MMTTNLRHVIIVDIHTPREEFHSVICIKNKAINVVAYSASTIFALKTVAENLY